MDKNDINLEVEEYDSDTKEPIAKGGNVERKFQVRIIGEGGKSKTFSFTSNLRIDRLSRDIKLALEKLPAEPESSEAKTTAKLDIKAIADEVARILAPKNVTTEPEEEEPEMGAKFLPEIPKPPKFQEEETEPEDDDYVRIDIQNYANFILQACEQAPQSILAITRLIRAKPNGRVFTMLEIEKFCHYLCRRKYLIFDGVKFRQRPRRWRL